MLTAISTYASMCYSKQVEIGRRLKEKSDEQKFQETHGITEISEVKNRIIEGEKGGIIDIYV